MVDMEKYTPKEIESKWQKQWEEDSLYKTPEDPKDKYYILPQLPYPSGSGLHVGHAEVYNACDIYARYQRMQGKDVLQVIGWDAFGLPAENYAIKTNVHPRESTDNAVDNFRDQIKRLGISVDWDREVGSHNPDYYKWTQWFFQLFYERGLAYRKKQAVNWCEEDKTVLANAQVEADGTCERCGTQVIQKEMEQWYIRITDYADRLLEGLDRIDWPEETIKRQRDWIGRSEGAEIEFRIKDKEEGITVFTTRPDTIFGVTYMVLAPEHVLVQELQDDIENWDEVEAYIKKTAEKTELDRQIDTEKTGVPLKGVMAVNPVSGEEVPVWIADYVLASYGTGAIMAVPAHDERDFDFAKKFGLEIRQVVAPDIVLNGDNTPRPELETVRNRRAVDAIIESPEGGEFLLQVEGAHVHFVGGGTDGEELNVALKREVVEETGYTSFTVKEKIFDHVFSEQFRHTKEKNQHGDSAFYHLQLDNREQIHSEADDGKHELIWVKKDDVAEKITWDHHAMAWDFFLKPAAYTDDGKIVNSDFLNGLNKEDAIEEAIKKIEELGVGKKKVQYKLRDWSVSRQRFWGAPVPMLINREEKEKKRTFILVHGFEGRPDSNYFPALKKQLEEDGHTVITPDLPNHMEPHVDEQAKHILDTCDITEDAVLLGHSLGGPVVFRVLEQLSHPVAKVILSDSFCQPEFVDKKRPYVEKASTWSFDMAQLKDKAREWVSVIDKDFPIIPHAHSEQMAKELGARLVFAQSQGGVHFDGLDQPELFAEVPVSGLKLVPITDLPVILPDDVDFKPTGESPLNYSPSFQEGVEEKYGAGWKREVDTLDTFMCSSWYFFRYLDPKNEDAFASPERLKQWMPVDFYLGGPEHVNGHLLYARFFTKVLYDAGYIDFDEPFTVHRHQGLILGEDNRKMSKRWGNVINPTDVVEAFGADTVRMYQMFMGPLEDAKPWSTDGVRGVRKFLDRVWRLQEKMGDSEPDDVTKKVHQTVKKVSEDMAEMKFNTAIAMMMELTNTMTKAETITQESFERFLKILAPFAPHIAEEMWHQFGHTDSVTQQVWPTYDEAQLVEDSITIVIQINGKVRDQIEISPNATKDEVEKTALAQEKVQEWLDGKEPKKVIYVPGKLVSIVV